MAVNNADRRRMVNAASTVQTKAIKVLAEALTETREYPIEVQHQIALACLGAHAQGRTWTDACAHVSSLMAREASPTLVRRWIDQTEDLRPLLEEARRACAEALIEATVPIADEGGVMQGEVSRDRLRIDVRARLAAAYDSARWGAKGVASSGPVSVGVTVQVAGDIAAALAGAGARIERGV